MPASTGITLDHVSKVYRADTASPVLALDDTTVRIRPGEFFSLVGPSGCGKTTVLNIIGGLLPPTTGTVFVGERRVVRPHPAVAMVFQRPCLLRWRTIHENVILPSKVNRNLTPSTYQDADTLLEMTGLTSFRDRYPAELSGGMQQRASIVRALSQRPEVLLMDEPFSALDEFTRERLNDELSRLWEAQQHTVLFITHSIAEAVYLSDRVGVMGARPGRILEIVDIDARRPRSPNLRAANEFFDQVSHIRRVIFGEAQG